MPLLSRYARIFSDEASVRKESVGVNGQRILNQAGLRCDATATFLFVPRSLVIAGNWDGDIISSTTTKS